ncbi:radical SAM protein (plasmid) [Fulvitalea axinellae]|uniref:Radical SAM protein n=1 Tax=Fulvitalea axinellae TaxID=1182444 RepID=A0AAU9CQF7_9BACT|nr:radical SAM protein [Fulvitalea axinellae]
MKILLITPPLTQLNTPYPATAFLKGFLTENGYDVRQADLGIELVLRIFKPENLSKIFGIAEGKKNLSPNAKRILALKDEYLETIDSVIRFLQGKNSTLAQSIVDNDYLPRASRFSNLQELDWAFGTMGAQDHGKYLATLYIEDLGDLIIEAIDPDFGFSRYAERLGRTASSFSPIEEKLKGELSFLDKLLLECLDAHIQEAEPDIVGFSVPFPGNLYGAFKCGQYIKKNYPEVRIIMGGGYPNTELRRLEDVRVFDYLDFICLDDGEGPLLELFDYIGKGEQDDSRLQRTYKLDKQTGQIQYCDNKLAKQIPHSKAGTPDYSDLPLSDYLSIIEVVNPMHRMWSDGRWNKLMVAHGCYWKKCTFCDVNLDYIGRYDPTDASQLVDRIEAIVKQTGQNGFHFVDEAAPPLLLRDLSIELLRRGVKINWWTNVRFEKTFSPDLCRLMVAAGCVAITGGLEVASDRLLKKMKKGVSIAQVARVTRDFTQAGIMVHAYLMYGFPTQTEQETVDSLEIVRQLFEHNVIQSGFWHQFAMTAHSPVGKNPEEYGVHRSGPEFEGFAENDLYHEDPEGCEHEQYGPGLSKAIFNYMHGMCTDWPVYEWFEFDTPDTTVVPDVIEQALQVSEKKDAELESHGILWLGKKPVFESYAVRKRGKRQEKGKLVFANKTADLEVTGDKAEIKWLLPYFDIMAIGGERTVRLKELKEEYENRFQKPFDRFLNGQTWRTLRKEGLLLLRM